MLLRGPPPETFLVQALLFNVSMTSLLPLLVSTISATVVSYIFRGQTPVFACTLTPFSMGNIPFYIILGVVGGFGSLYFMRTTLRLEDRIGKISNPYLRWGICALALGLLIFLFPPLYGEGYDSLGALLNGQEIEGDPACEDPGCLPAEGGGGRRCAFSRGHRQLLL